MDVARKYLDILKTTIYYKDWAENLMPILDNPKLIDEHHEFDSVRELRDHMGTVLDGDNGLCEMYLLNYFSNTMNKDSKLLQELTLNYALIQKDIQLFWPRFFLYAELHKGDEMPTHYQEAAYLYGNLEPQNVMYFHIFLFFSTNECLGRRNRTNRKCRRMTPSWLHPLRVPSCPF